MATSTLVGPTQSEMGAALLAKLDQSGMPIIAAFWVYPMIGGEGRFVIASPLVDERGTLPVYERVQAVMQQSPEIRLPLSAVYAVGEHDSVVRSLGGPNVGVSEFDAVVAFPNYSSYVPYRPEDQTILRVHVYRLGPPSSTIKPDEIARGEQRSAQKGHSGPTPESA